MADERSLEERVRFLEQELEGTRLAASTLLVFLTRQHGFNFDDFRRFRRWAEEALTNDEDRFVVGNSMMMVDEIAEQLMEGLPEDLPGR